MSLEVVNPATGARVATLPADDAASVAEKYARARAAQPAWAATPLAERLAAITRFRARVVAELKTTFASHYTQVVSLQEALQPAHIAVYAKRATGEKYLINPNKG